jgi:DUF1680 family protein
LSKEPLYQSILAGMRKSPTGEVRLIPYYTFDNREPTTMQVWIPYLR